MTKIRYVSDLHLEINMNYPIPEYIKCSKGNEILIVAGDTIVAYALDLSEYSERALVLKDNMRRFLNQIKGFKKVFFLMGNHEHYHCHFQSSKGYIEDFIKDCGYSSDHMMVLDNTAVDLDDNTVLLGCTLWTNMRNNNEDAHYFVGRGMNDFRVITYGNSRKTFTTYNAVFENSISRKFLTDEVERNKNKRVIIATHHTPSYLSNGRYNASSTITDGYCNDLEKFITDHPNITDWVHGHTHVNVKYKIGECNIRSNMRGYENYDHVIFDADTFKQNFIVF